VPTTPILAKRKNPLVAVILALLFGGLGCFYLGLVRGLQSTFSWLFVLFLISIVTNYPETEVIFIGLVQLTFAALAYRSCRRSNAKIIKIAEDHPPEATLKQQLDWGSVLLSYFGKTVLLLVASIFLVMATYIFDLAMANRRYARIRESLHSGMTIEEVLHKVQENGFIHGVPPPNEKNEINDITMFGPTKGSYYSLHKPGHWVSEKEAASLLQQNMLPRGEYRISFTFTPFYGPHWSLPVRFGPDGKVIETLPVRTWD
jgi:hypothetical protein